MLVTNVCTWTRLGSTFKLPNTVSRRFRGDQPDLRLLLILDLLVLIGHECAPSYFRYFYDDMNMSSPDTLETNSKRCSSDGMLALCSRSQFLDCLGDRYMEPIDRESGRKFELKVFGFQVNIWLAITNAPVQEIAGTILFLLRNGQRNWPMCVGSSKRILCELLLLLYLLSISFLV
jgi:hypothetical protein